MVDALAKRIFLKRHISHHKSVWQGTGASDSIRQKEVFIDLRLI